MSAAPDGLSKRNTRALSACHPDSPSLWLLKEIQILQHEDAIAIMHRWIGRGIIRIHLAPQLHAIPAVGADGTKDLIDRPPAAVDSQRLVGACGDDDLIPIPA